MKLLVCGGRDYSDILTLWAVLDAIHSKMPITHLIHGGASGADSRAADWADDTKGVQGVQCLANWRYGKSAGPIRNAAMLALGPDRVLAFPGGVGTAHMVKIARAAKIPTKVIKP